ncbi:MAG: tRNA (adenosine(37)-N6)-threonylcarbamoyltransferase complex ATPase subunit type 1 TsaE, partial [Pseudomonadota bacterium]
MTEFVWRVGPLAAETARLFAQVLAFKLQTGDCVALSGDVGAGKTTLARSIIRAITAEPELDVASPTYALMQSYASSRANIQHYDFYRLGEVNDVLEIGFEDGVADCITLVEWPERAEEILPDVRLSIDIEEV